MKRSFFGVLFGAALPVIAAIGGAWVLYATKKAHVAHEAKARAAEVDAGPKVLVATVAPSPTERTVTVLGEARPYASVTLYAKVSGYVRLIQVDKGQPVKKNALLAIIESPETDQQWIAAREDAERKHVEAQRAEALGHQGLMSPQDVLAAQTAADMAVASVAQLAAQKSYEVLRAPFDGTVTARFVDPGALVQNAANAQTGAQPVVSVATLDSLRIYGYFDQRDAAFVHEGDSVKILVDERPDAVLWSTVTRIAGALDPKTKTMLVEVDYDDTKHDVVPGGYVHLSVRVKVPSLPEVPVQALVLRGTETLAAVVDDRNHVRFRPVKVADTDGMTARITSGLSNGERVAMNLGESVADDTLIRPMPAPSASISASESESGSASASGSTIP